MLRRRFHMGPLRQADQPLQRRHQTRSRCERFHQCNGIATASPVALVVQRLVGRLEAAATDGRHNRQPGSPASHFAVAATVDQPAGPRRQKSQRSLSASPHQGALVVGGAQPRFAHSRHRWQSAAPEQRYTHNDRRPAPQQILSTIASDRPEFSFVLFISLVPRL